MHTTRTNRQILAGLSRDSEHIAVKFRRRSRNQLERHIVLEVSPKLWRRLVDTGRIYVGLQRRPVYDRSPLVQCSNCLGYGHTRKTCEHQGGITCGHCGGAHTRLQCEKRERGTPPQCCNCIRGKLPENERTHNAFSDICPIRKKWDSIARSRVTYC